MHTALFAVLSKLKLDAGKFRSDDDFSDRFTHAFTTLLLAFFIVVVSAKQYIGNPIACWCPAQFRRSQEEYVQLVCWVTNTYFASMTDDNLPRDQALRQERKLHYYQWVPFILMTQVIMCSLPCIIWRLFNWQSGIHLSNIMEVSCEIEMIKEVEMRRSNINYIARHIEDALANQREYRTGSSINVRQYLTKLCSVWFGKRSGNYLICLYLFVKLLYILSTVGQFFLMSHTLGDFNGFDIVQDFASGSVWKESGNFPRITFCDFNVQSLGGTRPFTVQCVLPINMFSEKIFIFLWFWFTLVAVVNLISFLYWSCKSIFLSNRVHFIRSFLKLRNVLETGEKKRTSTFVNTFLRQDGVFIIRLIAQNTSELVASELVERLWLIYKSNINRSSMGLKSGESVILPKPNSQDEGQTKKKPGLSSQPIAVMVN